MGLMLSLAGKARVGAILADGYNCITSTCSFIPLPPRRSGHIINIQERADLYFGHDDYLLWPQPYHPDSLPHLPFIRQRELDLADLSRAFLWLLPDKCQFTLCDLSACTGLGKLLISYLEVFQCFWLVLKSRTAPLGIDGSSLMLELIRQVEPLLDRLRFIATGFNMTCRTVRSLQHTLLEIEAFLECKTRLNMVDNVPSRSSPTPSIIGAYVNTVEDLVTLCHLGVPHWFIRSYEDTRNSWVEEVSFQNPSDLEISMEPSSRSLPIRVQLKSDVALYTAIRNFGNSIVTYPDPFHALVVPEALRSTQRKVGSKRYRALTPAHRIYKAAADRTFVLCLTQTFLLMIPRKTTTVSWFE